MIDETTDDLTPGQEPLAKAARRMLDDNKLAYSHSFSSSGIWDEPERSGVGTYRPSIVPETDGFEYTLVWHAPASEHGANKDSADPALVAMRSKLRIAPPGDTVYPGARPNPFCQVVSLDRLYFQRLHGTEEHSCDVRRTAFEQAFNHALRFRNQEPLNTRWDLDIVGHISQIQPLDRLQPLHPLSLEQMRALDNMLDVVNFVRRVFKWIRPQLLPGYELECRVGKDISFEWGVNHLSNPKKCKMWARPLTINNLYEIVFACEAV